MNGAKSDSAPGPLAGPPEIAPMAIWYRVFARGDAPPSPAAIEAHLASLGVAVRATFAGDEDGWFQAELVFGEGEPVRLERFLASEEGIRGELNSWAAFLETCEDSPHRVALMERTIQSRQLFTLRQPADRADEEVDRACVELSRFLARAADGFYQVDEQGLFEADGALLVREQ